MLQRLSKLIVLTSKSYNIINSQTEEYINTITSSNRIEAVIDTFNIIRNFEPEIWKLQVTLANNYGDLLSWVNSCYNPNGKNLYYLN